MGHPPGRLSATRPRWMVLDSEADKGQAMASNFMRCNETFWYSKGKKVDAGGRLWRADDPLVLRYGAFFSPIGDDGLVVEQATSAPGERRMLARFRPKVVEPEPEPEVEPEVSERGGRPWTTASKEEWTVYAQSIGVDPEGLTKSQLLDAVDARERASVGD